MVRISTSLILAILLIGVVAVVAYQASENSDLFSSPFLKSSDGDVMDKISPYLLEKFDEEEIVRVNVFMQGIFSGEPISEKDFNRIIKKVGVEKVSKERYPLGFEALLTMEDVMKLARNNNIKYIEFSYIFTTFLQDAVEIIDVIPVWETQILDEDYVFLIGEGQTICIIDTGIDFSHPDLAEKNIVGANINCVDDYPCVPDPDITDLNGHGTHVAGIAAAAGGINGIGKGANLIGLKIFPGSDGNGNFGFNLLGAIEWCTDNAEQYDISVISMSVGTILEWEEGYCDDFSPPFADVINNATALNISVVAATGNHGNTNGIAFPACLSNAIPVGATNKDDTLASYSNYNELVKLFAPGTKITSTCASGTNCDNGIYDNKTGTSMSAPMVSGLISIYRQYMDIVKVTITPQEIEQILFDTGDPIVGLPPESWTRINANQGFGELQLVLEDQCDIDKGDKFEQWGMWGNHPDTPFTCNLATSDAGMSCMDSMECESYCQAPKGSDPGDKVNGNCYEWEFAFCMQEVYDGIASGTWCI